MNGNILPVIKNNVCPVCNSKKLKKVLYAYVCQNCGRELYTEEIYNKLREQLVNSKNISSKYVNEYWREFKK